MFKKYFILFLVLQSVFTLFACKKDITKTIDNSVKPNLSISTEKPELDFNIMHNYVIDSISSEANPFFYIKEGKFDISGSNQPSVITISCTCLNGTTVDDLDLFLSLVLNKIAINACEQDFRFNGPEVDNTGTFINYGNVFNTYDIKFNAIDENNLVLRDNYIKAGQNIPIDSKFWME